MEAARGALDVRAAQREAIAAVLSSAGGGRWRVLVTDAETRAAVACVLPPPALRRHGVTLHAPLSAPPPPVPDAHTVFLLAPTPASLALLARALAAHRAPATVAFTAAPPPPALLALAARLPPPAPVARVAHLPAAFRAPAARLFALPGPPAPGLAAVLRALRAAPVIRAAPHGPAPRVAAALARLLRAHPVPARPRRRPLLLVLARDDVAPLLHHPATYRALLHDVLPARAAALHDDTDPFFAAHAASPFPAVAEAIEAALREYRDRVDALNAPAGPAPPAPALAAAVASLPELTRRKDALDAHTALATALLDAVNARALHAFYDLERHILSTPPSARAAEQLRAPVAQFIAHGAAEQPVPGAVPRVGTANDRLRLFLIYYAAFGRFLSEPAVAIFRAALRAAGADPAPVAAVARLRRFRHAPAAPDAPPPPLNAERLKGLMTNAVSRGYRSLAAAAQSAKKLVADDRVVFDVARTLELFMSEAARARAGPAAAEVLEGFELYDPNVVDEPDAAAPAPIVDEDGQLVLTARQKMQHMVFSDAIVFVVGPGNYVEYENCLEMVEALSTPQNPKNVLYGATELVTPEEYLKQLSEMEKAEAQDS